MQDTTISLDLREAGRIAAILESATVDATQATSAPQELAKVWTEGVAEGMQRLEANVPCTLCPTASWADAGSLRHPTFLNRKVSHDHL